jgi:hypothetical protein
MPILREDRSEKSRVDCVREVRVGVAVEHWRDAARFYIDLVGLRPWPVDRLAPGGWGLGDTERGVYLQFRHDPSVEPLRRRATLVVDSLDALAARMLARNWSFERIRGLGTGDDCLLTSDPTGHRLAFRQRRAL